MEIKPPTPQFYKPCLVYDCDLPTHPHFDQIPRNGDKTQEQAAAGASKAGDQKPAKHFILGIIAGLISPPYYTPGF